MALKAMITTPEDTSVISDGTPAEQMAASNRGCGRLRTGRNRGLRRRNPAASTPMLISGAKPVASAAPKMPSPSGKMNR